jgi:anaerobic selenocysteine-containing dehydrogenase
VSQTKEVKSVCEFCSAACGVVVTVVDGKPIQIKGNPESPNNKGGLCKIGQAALEYLYAPGRLTHPLRRVGERGGGRWEKIPWEEALEIAAQALNKAKTEHGPESVMMAHGSAKAFIDTHLVRLANAFGTPNVCTADHVCHVPHMLGGEFTFGFFPAAEYHHPPKCVVAWGSNKIETGFYKNFGFAYAVSQGAKSIVVDPLETPNAEKADMWLQVRPGTDAALALGMINVIINEGLFDRDFVENWTIGFDRLKEHVREYTPQRVEKITWVPEDRIVKAARIYANNVPGHIEWGNGLDESLNSFSASRAVAILMAITGNLDVPGGEVREHGTGFRYGDPESSGNKMRGRWSHELELRDLISRENRKKKVSPGLLPDFRYINSQDAVTAMLEGKPYYIRAAYLQAVNPLSSWSNVKRAAEGFQRLDFLAVSDFFLSATANLADIVFPSATFLEFDGIVLPPFGGLGQVQRKVARVGECRSNHEIINGLAWKLGLGKYFWKDMNQFWDYVLEPTGKTFAEVLKMDRYTGDSQVTYRKYEKQGFDTPSGKVDLYSQYLADQGFDPLPAYVEHPETPHGDPVLGKEYPLLCDCRKIRYFRHSTGRQISSLRTGWPEPLVNIHPDTAASLGIQDGDWVYVESKRARIMQKASLTTKLDPRVVYADYGWWFPEKGPDEEYGWTESNFNALTPDGSPCNPEVGSYHMRGFACKVYKAKA